MEHSGKHRFHCSRLTGRLQRPGHLSKDLRFTECYRMEARRHIEKMSRNVIARQRVNVVVQIARRGVAGDGVEKSFQLANACFYVIGNPVNLGPIACGKNYPATGVRRQPLEVFL